MNKAIIPTHDDQQKYLLHTIEQHEQDFISAIRTCFGITIHDHQIKELHNTLLDICNQFNLSPQDCLQKLYRNTNSSLLEHLATKITIGETYFFRDKQQMQLLQERLLPQIIERKQKQNNRNIRIWSAGCSTGEEIYTIAILLHELLPDIESWTIHLLATDLNTQALHKAIKGEYGQWAMRAIPEPYKLKYFSQKDQKYQLCEKIRNTARFEFMNLNDNIYPSILNGTNALDLILCRNVLIYFDAGHIEKIMQRFNHSLAEDGYLLLGASDPIQTSQTNLVYHHEESIYFSNSHRSPTPSIAYNKITLEATQAMLYKKDAKPKLLTTITPSSDSIDQLTQLLTTAQWQATLDFVDHYSETDIKPAVLLSAKAQALANLGKSKQAMELCQKSLQLDPTQRDTYFVFALILSELNRYQEAETALRKTIYLDHHFVPGHFQLGLMLLRQQHHQAGLKCLENVLTIVSDKQENEAVVGSPGLTCGKLKEIIQHEMNIYNKDSNHAT